MGVFNKKYAARWASKFCLPQIGSEKSMQNLNTNILVDLRTCSDWLKDRWYYMHYCFMV
jgi:hypothetical protein